MSAVGLEKPTNNTDRRRSGLAAMLVVHLLLVFAVASAGWTWWTVRRYRSAMAEINAAMAAGRFGVAARNLEQLLAWKPDADEAAYVLGMCEQARGRTREADQAWARVAPGSAFTQRATLARLRLFHDSGRLAAAERAVIDAANDPRNDATDLLVLLVPIYSQIGRAADAERLIENRWEHLFTNGEATPEQSIKLVRVHMDLTWKAPSIEELRLYLDQVGRAAPEDDRVWLGRADLAIRTGVYGEADKWLDACERRRPEDVAVWKARLRWGLAFDRTDAIQPALKHVPPSDLTLADLHRLSAWLCSSRGDLEGERRELEGLLAAAPVDLKALDRLTKLAEKHGQSARAIEIQTRKAKLASVRSRYLELYQRTQHVRDAEEMAHLAQELGRTFEARVFLALAIGQEPQREDLKREFRSLGQAQRAGAPQSEALDDAVARYLAKDGKTVVAPRGQ